MLTVLQAHNEQSAKPAGNKLFEEISYWAPLQARQTEVDFLLRRGKEYLAIEVKAQTRFSPEHLSGLRAIADLGHVARRVMVYVGERRLRTEDGIEVWPLHALLPALEGNKLWP